MEWLASVVKFWEEQAKAADKTKHRQFGKVAQRAWDFIGKSYKELYIDPDNPEDEPFKIPTPPQYRTRLNKSREFVSLYTPHLHNKVPNFLVSPWRPALPPLLQELGIDPPEQQAQDELRCTLAQWFVNYVPRETNLFWETRNAIQEALVKGRGVVWFELTESPNGDIPAGFFDSVDNLLIDSDCVQMRDAAFIMRKRRRSKWAVAREWDIPVEDLPAQLQTDFSASVSKARGDTGNERTEDIVEYYECWSRMGVGNKSFYADSTLKELERDLDALGDYVYLCICPGVPYPLNLHPKWFAGEDREQQLQERCRWPLEFHDDIANPWPVECLDFIPSIDTPWATSPLEAALPLQSFLDHAYSFLMGRTRAATRALVMAWKRLPQEAQDRLVNGGDLELLLMDDPVDDESLKKYINIIQFEPLKSDLWRVIDMVSREFEKQTGMDPLLYGSSGSAQSRSATEAKNRENHVTSRPSDFADIVEEWMSRIGRKIGVASRLYVGPETLGNLFREPIQEAPSIDEQGQPVPIYGKRTMAWMQLVHTDDPRDATAELMFSIEAGSGRRRNLQSLTDAANQITQTLLGPMLQFYQQTGDSTPYNALMALMNTTLDGVVPMNQLMLPKQQPQQQQQGPPPPDPEQEAAAAAQQQDMEMRGQETQQNMAMQAAQRDQEMQVAQQQQQMEAARHEQEMRHRDEAHAQDMMMKQEQAKAQAKAAQQSKQHRPQKK
jgi:hypothetical protein